MILIKETLQRNSLPPFLIDKITKPYLETVHNTSDQSNPESDKTPFYRLPYIGNYSEQVQKKFPKICKEFCKGADLKMTFTSFKINNYFSTKGKTRCFMTSFLNFLVQDVILVKLSTPLVTLKLESMKM